MFSSLWLGMDLKEARAKTVRAEIDEAFFSDPVYREGRFPTAAHVAALRALGPCPEHRRSFGPVSQLTLF